jgi:predicted membrane protein
MRRRRAFGASDYTENCSMHMSGISVGIIVIGIGLVWLLRSLGVVSLPGMNVLWPSILVAVGFLKLFHRPLALPRLVFALGLMVSGGLLQLSKLGYITVDVHTLWPILVMVLGVMIIWISAHHKRRHLAMVSENQISKFVMFGGEETRITAKSFEGGDLTLVFAGADLDFRDADIAGESAVLNISAIFGGAEIKVPPHFETTIQGTPILGGFENKTRVPDRIPENERKKLIIKATAIFGGIEVKN